MRSRGVVYVDETVDQYEGLRLPSNWTMHLEPVWGSIGASMRWCFAKYPRASRYGWLADDTVPRTDGWDASLERAAGRWGLACARDGYLSEDPNWRAFLESGEDLSAGLCWGGDLVRAVGWWAPPWLTQAGIDTTWTALTSPLGLGTYVEDVTVEHKNWRTGKRHRDAGDEWDRGDDPYVARDLGAYEHWRAAEDYLAALEDLRAACSP